MIRLTLHHRALQHAVAVAALLIAASAVPVAAGLSGHTGTRGVHVLIDSVEYPGQTCQYDASAPGDLHRIAVRRPVIFAPDVTAGRDHRWVGWRIRLQRAEDESDWETFYTSDIRKALAYDDRPAALEPRGKAVTGDADLQYRTAVDLFWYTASSSTTLTGRATHTTLYSLYDQGPGNSGPTSGPCAGSIGTLTATEPSGSGFHDGDYGLHTLVDSPLEYPGVTCVYRGASLVRIKVRAPVVYAFDATNGPDPQQVRWRFTVKGSDSGPPGTQVHQSSWTKAPATDQRAAAWRGRVQPVDGADWTYWVVSVRMEWLGGPTPRPYAVHGPYHKVQDTPLGYCFGTLI